MAFEGVQDGELGRVLQGEDDDFARVVESWRSSDQQAAVFGWHHRRYGVTWLVRSKKKTHTHTGVNRNWIETQNRNPKT